MLLHHCSAWQLFSLSPSLLLLLFLSEFNYLVPYPFFWLFHQLSLSPTFSLSFFYSLVGFWLFCSPWGMLGSSRKERKMSSCCVIALLSCPSSILHWMPPFGVCSWMRTSSFLGARTSVIVEFLRDGANFTSSDTSWKGWWVWGVKRRSLLGLLSKTIHGVDADFWTFLFKACCHESCH